jgi:hypothetical protein
VTTDVVADKSTEYNIQPQLSMLATVPNVISLWITGADFTPRNFVTNNVPTRNGGLLLQEMKTSIKYGGFIM